ncbi:hypothetical protein J6TS1_12230 [Siminovitchia terrae]|uniref:YtxH domain-containing protein n=1 Tax=Siminovitchia terrae TaxID=1914933 RepID=A0ABQ4KTJ2_SIMTE|nr:hypothetical protein [Siminovitchia terrae]GIN95353.1 hypothetical protein J6TS1_12230 [Siminovitchia terrae]
MGKAGKMPYVLLGFGMAGALLSSKENREKVLGLVGKVKEKAIDLWGSQEESEWLKKAGRPDPYDFEDAKMVEEGAQYSINYYNKKVQQS